MNTARYSDTATLLDNGQVLVAGGKGAGGTLSSAELYNPTTNTWSATGSLNTARYYDTATLLNNGQVLVAGGDNEFSGTLSSAELYFEPPFVTSLSPPSASTGSASFTLTVIGTDFQSDSAVQWNGAPLTTTYGSPFQLTATVPASDLAVAYGSVTITVVNPTTDAGTSSPALFYLDTPNATAPTLTSPTSTSITSSSATLGGTVADNGALIQKRGILYAPTATNGNPTIGGTGVIEVDDAAAATGSFTESVTGPNANTSYSMVAFATNDIGTGYTNPVSTFGPLSLASLSPASAVTGSGSFTLTVNGSGFQSDSIVNWNGVPLATTNVTFTQIQATVPASFLAVAYGSVTITVVNPTTNSGTTGSKVFYLDAPGATAPTLTNPTATSITTNSATLGGTVADNGALIQKRGILYALTAINGNPTIGGTGVIEVDDAAATTGSFTETVTGLTPGTGYSYVAFATNHVGTAYSSPVSLYPAFLSAVLAGGDLTITDTNPTAFADNFTVTVSGADLVISDTTQLFMSTPAGGTLSADFQTLTIPASSVTGKLIVNAGGGDDTINVEGLVAPFVGGLTIDGVPAPTRSTSRTPPARSAAAP